MDVKLLKVQALENKNMSSNFIEARRCRSKRSRILFQHYARFQMIFFFISMSLKPRILEKLAVKFLRGSLTRWWTSPALKTSQSSRGA